MGARTNFTIVTTADPNQNINLYSHWGGDSGVMDLALALNKAMSRITMGDAAYATRIIINALQDCHNNDTGYGLYVGDINHEEQYEYKEVNLTNNTVTVGDITKPIDKFVTYYLDEVSAEHAPV